MKFLILAALFAASQASLEMYGLKPEEMCCWWASLGECDTNVFWMRPGCQSQCGTEGCDVSDAANCKVTVRSDCVQWNEQSEGYDLWVQAYNRVNGGNGATDVIPAMPAAQEPVAPVVEAAPVAPVVEAAPVAPVVEAAPVAPVKEEPVILIEQQMGYGTEEAPEPIVEEVPEPEPVMELPVPEPLVAEPIEVFVELPAAPVEEVVEPSGYGMVEEEEVVEPVEMAPLPAEPEVVEEEVVEEEPLPVEPVMEQEGYGSVEPAPLEPMVEEELVEPMMEEVVEPVVEEVLEDFVDTAAVAGDLVNNHKLCSYWAFIGECEKNKGYMAKDCSKACAEKQRRRRF